MAVREDLEKAPIIGARTGLQVNSEGHDPHRLRLAARKKQRRPGRLAHKGRTVMEWVMEVGTEYCGSYGRRQATHI